MTDIKSTTEAGWNLDNSYTCLPEFLFTKINPAPVSSPKMALLNFKVAETLGLNTKILQSDDGVAWLAGNQIPKGTCPIAQAYAGHQFGYFTMLGDGRAILIGEQITPKGYRVDIQLKGSGKTPYSRRGDGRAALGPMLREYIMSEAMHALDISTTRSLAVVTTGEAVLRDSVQPGAILTRVADSHIRVGTFEYASGWGTDKDVRALADYTFQRHFSDVDIGENPYLTLLQQVVKRQAALIAKWQLVGFIHGVMNTDNMAISGETIDYGPCAFMDIYDPNTVFSSIDLHGRYAYGNQPLIAAWNLSRFAEALLPLLNENQDKAIKLANDEISAFSGLYQGYWIAGMRSKLGIFNEEKGDEALIEDLLNMMYKNNADYTNTFRALTFDEMDDTPLFGKTEFDRWYESWQHRLDRQIESKDISHQLMRNSNPAVIPRNHRVEEALEEAVKHEDYSVMERFINVLASPYAHTPEQVEYSSLPVVADCPYKTFCGT